MLYPPTFLLVLPPVCKLRFQCVNSAQETQPQALHFMLILMYLTLGANIMHTNFNKIHPSK